MERPRLLDRFGAALDHRLTLVSAPTGFGKSVLAAQWAASFDAAPLGWLTLDDTDNDARRLANNLLGVLGTGEPGFGTTSLDRVAAGADGFGRAFITELLDELRFRSPVVVVLDDLEAIKRPELVADLVTLFDQAPPTLHVVALTRADPPVSLHRLRLTGGVAEIRQADLAFDGPETRELLERVAGRTVTDAQAVELRSRTEGWPAGIQMAAIALREAVDVDAAIESFSGGERSISSYLTDEVLSHLEPGRERFLLETSVLTRMSGPLCDAVTGGTGSYAVLDQLEREALFVNRLAGENGWYRYHRLFREVLRHRLRAAEPEVEGTLLQRAASWHLERDELGEAARYLVAAEDWDGVIALARAHGRSYYEAGRAGTVIGWLDAVPETVRRRDPIVGLEHAALSTMAGNALVADSDLTELEATHRLSPGQQLVAGVLRTTWVEDHQAPESVLDRCDDALRILSDPPDEVPDLFGLTGADGLRLIAHVSRGRALLYSGSADEARHELEAIVGRGEEGNLYGPWVVNALGTLALIDAWTGRLRDSEERSARAIRRVNATSADSHPSTAHAHLAMGEVLLEHDELGQADLVLSQAGVLASSARRPIPIALHHLLRARLALARKRPERGLAEFDRLRASGLPPLPSALADRALAVEVQLLLAAGQLDRAERLLGPALDDPRGWLSPAAAALLVHQEDLDGARQVLDAAVDQGHNHRIDLECDLWRAVVAGHSDPRLGQRLLADVVARAEPECQMRLFLDGGRPIQRALRSLFDADPTPFLHQLVDDEVASASTWSTTNQDLIDPLSERELVVLAYLATRLANAEIAAQLFVSVNTLKTHLRHIYAKLDVNGRRAAVVAAERAGLI